MRRTTQTTNQFSRRRGSGARSARLLALVLLLAAGVLLAGPAQAQESGSDATPRVTESGSVGGLAGAFFISKRTDPATGEKHTELLGSFIIWFLILLSMLSIGLIGNMAMTNQRKSIVPDGVVEEVRSLMNAGKYRETLDLTARDPSFFGQVMNAGLREANHGFSAIIRSLEQTSDELTTVRLRRIEYLNVLGQVSPMIGLFGTVYGMILAFQAIVISGGNADPILLAGGIGTALTTTFWGLIVAIPALGGYAIVRNRIDELTTDATLRAEELLNQFRPKAAGRATTQPRPRAAQKTPAAAQHPES